MLNKYFTKLFPKKFGDYWNKIKNDPKIDKDLRFITNSFITSKSYKYVSNQWHFIIL